MHRHLRPLTDGTAVRKSLPVQLNLRQPAGAALSRRGYIKSLVCLSHLCRDKRIIRRPNKSGDIHPSLFY